MSHRDAPTERLFGKFFSWESRETIHCIWDMKAFGEKCKFLKIVGDDCSNYNGVVIKMKGVLFDINEFWMIRSSGNTFVDVENASGLREGPSSA